MADTESDPVSEKGPLEAALDASVQENLRLARELADAEEGMSVLIELLGLLIETWRNGCARAGAGSLEPRAPSCAAA